METHMGTFMFLLTFFAGIFLVFVLGYFLGQLFKLDKYLEGDQNDNKNDDQNDNNKKL